MKTKKLTFGAMCLAISLLLPQVFHIIGMQQAGSVFLQCIYLFLLVECYLDLSMAYF